MSKVLGEILPTLDNVDRNLDVIIELLAGIEGIPAAVDEDAEEQLHDAIDKLRTSHALVSWVRGLVTGTMAVAEKDDEAEEALTKLSHKRTTAIGPISQLTQALGRCLSAVPTVRSTNPLSLVRQLKSEIGLEKISVVSGGSEEASVMIGTPAHGPLVMDKGYSPLVVTTMGVPQDAMGKDLPALMRKAGVSHIVKLDVSYAEASDELIALYSHGAETAGMGDEVAIPYGMQSYLLVSADPNKAHSLVVTVRPASNAGSKQLKQCDLSQIMLASSANPLLDLRGSLSTLLNGLPEGYTFTLRSTVVRGGGTPMLSERYSYSGDGRKKTEATYMPDSMSLGYSKHTTGQAKPNSLADVIEQAKAISASKSNQLVADRLTALKDMYANVGQNSKAYTAEPAVTPTNPLGLGPLARWEQDSGPEGKEQTSEPSETEKETSGTLPSTTPTISGSDSAGVVAISSSLTTEVSRLPTIPETISSVASAVKDKADAQRKRRSEENSAAKVVFAYWQEVMGKPRALFDDRRRSRIIARLRENSGDVGELLFAIDGAEKDDWLMGRDNKSGGKKYNDIETVLRDRAQVEKLAESIGAYQRGEEHPIMKAMQRGEA